MQLLKIGRPEIIFFDWDGTLIDTNIIVFNAVNATFRKFNLEPLDFQSFKLFATKSARDYFPSIFKESYKEALDYFLNQYHLFADESFQPFEGAENTLKDLTQSSIPLIIISNKRGDLLRSEVAKLNWQKYFILVVGSGDAASDKPSIEPIKYALQKAQMPHPKVSWFIGDTLTDMQTAHSFGSKAIFFGDDIHLIDEKFKPALQVNSYKELADFYKDL